MKVTEKSFLLIIRMYVTVRPNMPLVESSFKAMLCYSRDFIV